MTDHSTPSAEPASDAAARAAQVAAMSLSVAEALARLRAQRNAERRLHERQSAAELRIMRAAARTAARRTWSPALNRAWVRQASTHDLLAAWSAAQPWTSGDPLAKAASARVEQRLLERHPEAMRRYQQARSDGHHPMTAMRHAATAFVAGPAIDMPRGEAALRMRTPADQSARAVIVGESFPTPIGESITDRSRTVAVAVTTLPAPAGRHPTHRNRGPS
jgi:hypothetical protein